MVGARGRGERAGPCRPEIRPFEPAFRLIWLGVRSRPENPERVGKARKATEKERQGRLSRCPPPAALRSIPSTRSARHAPTPICTARGRQQSVERGPWHHSRQLRQRPGHRGPPELQLAGHSGHAPTFGQDVVGFHAGGLEAGGRALDGARGLRAGYSARARTARQHHARDGAGGRARAPSQCRAGA